MEPSSPTKAGARTRLRSLDVLRAIAVFLVIGRHGIPGTHFGVPALDSAFRVLKRGGWIGVDLFFVLSGFLVAGLLFREHARHGRINVKRFLVRRGLKIYPAYWALLLCVLFGWIKAGPFTTQNVIGDLLYLQNYVGSVWGHSWSLAIEEHFYLLLPLCLHFLTRRSRDPERPFRRLPALFLLVALACLAMRLSLVRIAYTPESHLFPTHLRVDSLFFGVFLAYVHQYHPALLVHGTATRTLLGCLGALLLLPAFVLELSTQAIVPSLGLTTFYLGSGLLLVAMLPGRFEGRLARGTAAIGRHSYSIYLWHIPVRYLVGTNSVDLGLTAWSSTALYVVGSVAVGILAARIVELPVLRIRDRLFPTRSGALELKPKRDCGSEGSPLT